MFLVLGGSENVWLGWVDKWVHGSCCTRNAQFICLCRARSCKVWEWRKHDIPVLRSKCNMPIAVHEKSCWWKNLPSPKWSRDHPLTCPCLKWDTCWKCILSYEMSEPIKACHWVSATNPLLSMYCFSLGVNSSHGSCRVFAWSFLELNRFTWFLFDFLWLLIIVHFLSLPGAMGYLADKWGLRELLTKPWPPWSGSM